MHRTAHGFNHDWVSSSLFPLQLHWLPFHGRGANVAIMRTLGQHSWSIFIQKSSVAIVCMSFHRLQLWANPAKRDGDAHLKSEPHVGILYVRSYIISRASFLWLLNGKPLVFCWTWNKVMKVTLACAWRACSRCDSSAAAAAPTNYTESSEDMLWCNVSSRHFETINGLSLWGTKLWDKCHFRG